MPHRKHFSDDIKLCKLRAEQVRTNLLTSEQVVVSGLLSSPRLDRIEASAQQRLHMMLRELDMLKKRVTELEQKTTRIQNTSAGSQLVIEGAPLVIRPESGPSN
jgi:hypothetical protein